jgi:hypothetical protein
MFCALAVVTASIATPASAESFDALSFLAATGDTSLRCFTDATSPAPSDGSILGAPSWCIAADADTTPTPMSFDFDWTPSTFDSGDALDVSPPPADANTTAVDEDSLLGSDFAPVEFSFDWRTIPMP